MTRRTKIVATIGPASDRPESLEALIRAGVERRPPQPQPRPDRGPPRSSRRVTGGRGAVGKPVGVLADLPGPKIRSGSFPEGGVCWRPARSSICRPGNDPSDADTIYVDYETLLDDLAAGDPSSSATEPSASASTRFTATSSRRSSRRAAAPRVVPASTCPSERLRLTTPTEEDLVLAEQVAAAGVEFIAVSFVRQAADIGQVRESSATGRSSSPRSRRAPRWRTCSEILEASRCDHGRARRPRHRLSARGRPPPPEDRSSGSASSTASRSSRRPRCSSRW